MVERMAKSDFSTLGSDATISSPVVFWDFFVFICSSLNNPSPGFPYTEDRRSREQVSNLSFFFFFFSDLETGRRIPLALLV